MTQKDRMMELLKEAGIIKKIATDSIEKCGIALGIEMLTGTGAVHEEFTRYAFNLAVSTIAEEIMNTKGEEHEEITEKHRTR